jgi:hypothetical protein
MEHVQSGFSAGEDSFTVSMGDGGREHPFRSKTRDATTHTTRNPAFMMDSLFISWSTDHRITEVLSGKTFSLGRVCHSVSQGI